MVVVEKACVLEDEDNAGRNRKEIRCKVVIVGKSELTHTAQMLQWSFAGHANGAMERGVRFAFGAIVDVAHYDATDLGLPNCMYRPL
jgi:hypothetical protein